MELCLECGVPDVICRGFEWSGGGSIVNRSSGKEYVFLDCRLLTAVYDTLTFLDGPRAGLIMCEVRRRTVKEEAVRSLGFLARHSRIWFVRRRALSGLRDLAVCCGYGNFRIRSYEPSGRAVLEVAHPYFLPFVDAELRAYWEAVEGEQPWVKMEAQGGTAVFQLENPESKEKDRKSRVLHERFRPEERPSSGKFERTTCTSCGAPIEISRFTWNLAAGTVYDPTREAHVCLISVASMEAIIQELKKHYGKEVEDVMARTARKYMRGLVRGNMIMRNLGKQEFLRSLVTRGEVYIVGAKERPRTVEIEIRNPWSAALVAGEIAGWMEEKERVRMAVEWDMEGEAGTIRLKPADAITG